MDTKKKNNILKGTSGLLSLEASIALTAFILLMLLMTSFFVIYEARNEMAHVLLTTADSLALDPFANEVPKENTVQSILYELYGKNADSEGTFTDHTKWYAGDAKTLEKTVRARFASYLAGGKDKDANDVLKQLNIDGGVESLDFSKCRVEAGKLYLEVRYKINYEFQVFGMEGFEMKQSCCSKLWLADSKTSTATDDKSSDSDGGGFR